MLSLMNNTRTNSKTTRNLIEAGKIPVDKLNYMS